MSFIELLLTGLSLALDAAAVSLAAGALHPVTRKQALKIAFFFGLFQLLMPLFGWASGLAFKDYFSQYGNIIGFGLLFSVGMKMFADVFKKEDQEDIEKEKHLAETKILIPMAFATSIDAFAVGITFLFLPVNIPVAMITIGLVTFILSLFAIYVGMRSRHLMGNKIELIGAVFLIGLAFKILLS